MDHHIKFPQKVSGSLVSKKPISLSRAAKLISRFAAVENGSSPAVSLYLQRSAHAFNNLVESRDKRSKPKNLDAPTEEHSEKVERERASEKQIVNGGGDAAEAPARRKKKKKRGSGEDNLDSKGIQTEKDSENLVRDRERGIIIDGDAADTPKEKKSGEASLDSKIIQAEKIAGESNTEIINAAEAPSKQKQKKKKGGESKPSFSSELGLPLY